LGRDKIQWLHDESLKTGRRKLHFDMALAFGLVFHVES